MIDGRTAPIAVVMGVSCCGKTTVGHELATRLGVRFGDGDAFHPPENIAKMTAGHPLDDEDRQPWLRRIGEWLVEQRDGGAVVACSALKRQYRDLIRAEAPETRFLHLAGPQEAAYARSVARSEHFMPASLLQSQYDTLQPLDADEHGLTIDFTLSVEELVTRMVSFLDTDSHLED